ncbi:MAG: putative metallopeptidase [Pseudomonadota bacterium]
MASDICAVSSCIVSKLLMTHVDKSRLFFVRSQGSESKRIIARCHGLPRIMQLALNQKPLYVIEVISEKFDKLSREDRIRVLIHELMHIPHSFGGGFRAHKPYVTQRNVDAMCEKFLLALAPDGLSSVFESVEDRSSKLRWR